MVLTCRIVKFGVEFHAKVRPSVNVVKIGPVTVLFYLKGCNCVPSSTLHVYYPVWKTFGVTDLQIWLLGNREYAENRCQKGSTSILMIGKMKLHLRV
jgi:hypothetical protein